MTDPGLKLPLSSRPSVMLVEKHRWVVVDADDIPLQLTKHQSEVIVAALTADAEQSGCKLRHWLLHCDECGWSPDAEKEVRGG